MTTAQRFRGPSCESLWSGGPAAASNTLDCVRMHPGLGDDLNELAVGDFLLVGCSKDRGATVFRDVARLPPGHSLVVRDGQVRVRRYFALEELTASVRPRG